MATKAKTIVIENFKPDWSEAPPWANWAAVDGDGELYFYAETPSPSFVTQDSWNNASHSKFCQGYHIGYPVKNWQDMLFEKPGGAPATESGSNKPDWADAPSWAMWLACDGPGGDHERQWWWFEKEPKMSVTGLHKNVWKNTGGHAKNSDKVAPEDWAEHNWKFSKEYRPEIATKPEQPAPSWENPPAPNWNVPAKYQWWAVDWNGESFYYIEEPVLDEDGELWINPGGKNNNHRKDYDTEIDEDWANDNWTESLLQRPQPEPESPNKKRVTLFIEFSGPVDDDEQLAQNVAEMLCNRLGHEPEYIGSKFTPNLEMVDRIKVAVGTIKWREVIWEETGDIDTPSNYNVKGLKK